MKTDKCKVCNKNFKRGDFYYKINGKKFLWKRLKITLCAKCFDDGVCCYCKQLKHANPCKDCREDDYYSNEDFI